MKTLISLLLVILGVSSLTACSGKGVEEMKYVRPRTDGKPGKPDEKPQPRELTVADKFLLRAVQGHRISHEIFSELWMHIWEDRMSRPNTIFAELSQFIEAHRDLKANHYNSKNIQCPDRMTQMLVNFKDATKASVSSVQFQIADCSDMKNPKWQDAAVATVQDKSSVRWDIKNQFFAKGAGKHLSADKNPSKCIVEHLDERKISSLHCELVGQSRDNETHLLFSQLDFDRDSDQLVIAQGKKFKNGQEACDDPKYCTVIKVPAEGTIEIIEKVSNKSEKPTLEVEEAKTETKPEIKLEAKAENQN